MLRILEDSRPEFIFMENKRSHPVFRALRARDDLFIVQFGCREKGSESIIVAAMVARFDN